MVRQVRLELTIPCLRGRCLDPIWLLTHGGTERTRTVIDLIDNQVPHLSATVPKNRFRVWSFAFRVRDLRNPKLVIRNWPYVGVTCGVEPSSLHSQCSVLTNYTKAT